MHYNKGMFEGYRQAVEKAEKDLNMPTHDDKQKEINKKIYASRHGISYPKSAKKDREI